MEMFELFKAWMIFCGWVTDFLAWNNSVRSYVSLYYMKNNLNFP